MITSLMGLEIDGRVYIEKIPMKYLSHHSITSIYTLPQKKEFIFKFQENQNICTIEINQELSSFLESIR